MQHLITTGGYAAIFLLMIAESACIPIPSEVIMLFGGALAATGHLSLAPVIILGALGNLVGSFIAWAVGRAGGRPAIRRWGRFIWLKDSDVDRAERWFERRGAPAVFFGRMVPVVRTFISLPAGVARMEPVRFGTYTLAGSIPWTAALGVAGYEIGAHWASVAHGFHDATYVIAVIAVLCILAALAAGWRRWRVERTAKAREQASQRAKLAAEATTPPS
jgi:membrane protein DedA with SNARE-associated domain